MKFVDVLFSDFVPDRGGAPWPEDPGYLVDAENVYPTPNGWKPYPAARAFGSATAIASTAGANVSQAFVSENVQAAAAQFFAITSQTIWQSPDRGATWNNVTPSTAMSATDRWDWEQFDELVVITGVGAGTPRAKDLTTATAAAAFVDLGGSPPSAQCVARVRDHLVLGGITTALNDVHWSSINDPEDWPTPGSATALARQSDSHSLPDKLGQVIKIVGNEEFGIVFQQRGISRMTYVGGDVMYQFDTYEWRIGAGDAYPQSFARAGDLVYWANEAGVFATDGYKVIRLSGGAIDEAFFLANDGFPDTFDKGKDSLVDENRNCILIAPATGSQMLGFRYDISKFFTVPSGAAALFDAPADVALSRRVPLVFNTSELVQQLTAAPSSIAIQTGFIELAAGLRVQLQAVQLLGSSTDAPSIGYKASDTVSGVTTLQTGFTAMTAAQREDRLTGRDTGRYFAFRLTGSQGLDATLKGLRIFYEPVSRE